MRRFFLTSAGGIAILMLASIGLAQQAKGRFPSLHCASLDNSSLRQTCCANNVTREVVNASQSLQALLPDIYLMSRVACSLAWGIKKNLKRD